jgi:hypothetical protein
MTVAKEPKTMTCEEFQNLLPQLIGTGEDINLHPHIETCELCRAFLSDLEAIAEAARQLFPAVEPPDDLWSSIESAIQQEQTPPRAEPAKKDGKDGAPEEKLAAAPGDEEPSAV